MQGHFFLFKYYKNEDAKKELADIFENKKTPANILVSSI